MHWSVEPDPAPPAAPEPSPATPEPQPIERIPEILEALFVKSPI